MLHNITACHRRAFSARQCRPPSMWVTVQRLKASAWIMFERYFHSYTLSLNKANKYHCTLLQNTRCRWSEVFLRLRIPIHCFMVDRYKINFIPCCKWTILSFPSFPFSTSFISFMKRRSNFPILVSLVNCFRSASILFIWILLYFLFIFLT